MNFEEMLDAKDHGDGRWSYQLTKKLNGGFGGTNGGVLAAICVNAARALAKGRRPVGLDARFIRGFQPGTAQVTTTLLNHGRTLSTVSVDIVNDEGKLATRGTVTLVDSDALASLDMEDIECAEGKLKEYQDGKIWREPPNQAIPLISTFQPRFLGKNSNGIATAVNTIWSEGNTLEEASCIAADISVGPPVAAGLKGKPLAIPNPDLSLRFTGVSNLSPWLVSTCRLEAMNSGQATTRLEVRMDQTLVAIGVSTTTCLKS